MCAAESNDHLPGKRPERSAAEQWTHHEHVADPVVSEAQRLVNLAGSVELAKQSLNAATEPLSAADQAELAVQLGYDSYESLLAASTVVVGADNSVWCITQDRNRQWVVWDASSNQSPRLFPSMEEAVGSILDERKTSSEPE